MLKGDQRACLPEGLDVVIRQIHEVHAYKGAREAHRPGSKLQTPPDCPQLALRFAAVFGAGHVSSDRVRVRSHIRSAMHGLAARQRGSGGAPRKTGRGGAA